MAQVSAKNNNFQPVAYKVEIMWEERQWWRGKTRHPCGNDKRTQNIGFFFAHTRGWLKKYHFYFRQAKKVRARLTISRNNNERGKLLWLAKFSKCNAFCFKLNAINYVKEILCAYIMSGMFCV